MSEAAIEGADSEIDQILGADLGNAPAPKKARLLPARSMASSDSGATNVEQLGCVVLVEVISAAPDYVRPWKMHSQKTCKGSGFVIKGQRILTNFHVVQDAIDVRLRKHGQSRRWRGKVVACGPDVDLAILEVHEEEAGKGASFWSGVTPAAWSPTLPSLQSAVHVIGFPTGGSTISVTQGVVSRIDCKPYRIGPTSFASPGGLLVLQIDAAINPGNSGGPAFAKDGTVVGVAFQSLGGYSDGIGYLIPAIVCENFLKGVDGVGDERVSPPPYAGVTDVPFLSRELRNASLRHRHHVPDDLTGVLVTKVSPHSAVALRPNDVIVAIDGKTVGDDGTVELRGSELVWFQFLMTCKPAGQVTAFSVLREGERLELCAVLAPLPHILPRTNGFDCTADYVIIGGLVFTRLSCPLLEDRRSKTASLMLFDLVNFQIAKSYAEEVDGSPREWVVLTEVLAAPLNYGYKNPTWWALDTLNGERIHSLRALYEAYMRFDGEFLEFLFSHGGDAIVLDAAQCRQSEADILRMHAIPSIVSKGLACTASPH